MYNDGTSFMKHYLIIYLSNSGFVSQLVAFLTGRDKSAGVNIQTIIVLILTLIG